MSDRFYLNSIESLKKRDYSIYLFNRQQYMQRLLQEDVKCVILSTYGLNVRSSQLEISDLLGPGSIVPTLIIHGDNRKVLAEATVLRKERSNKKHTVGNLCHTATIKVENSAFSIKLEKEDAVEFQKKCIGKATSAAEDSNNLKLAREKSQIDIDKDYTLQEALLTYPDSVCIERVRSQWSPPEILPDMPDSNTFSGNSSSRNFYTTREPVVDDCCTKGSEAFPTIKNASAVGGKTLGVHHAKYILTFTSKGIHVLISTSNLTPQTSAEASWTDFFPLRGSSEIPRRRNDFGSILQNFISEQSKQILKVKKRESSAKNLHDKSSGSTYYQHSDPVQFILKHTGVSDLDVAFDFSNAQVDLVTSVPSRQPIDPPTCDEIIRLHLDRSNRRKGFCPTLQLPCKRCLTKTARLGVRASIQPGSEVVMDPADLKDNVSNSEPDFRINEANRHMKVKVEGNISTLVPYGLQRCRQLLMRNSTLLPRKLNHNDELIIQPTSISSGIDLDYIGYFLSHLMPEESWAECYAKYEMLRIDCCRFVWPKLSFIRKCIALTDYRKDYPGGSSEHNQLCFNGNIRNDYCDNVDASVSKCGNSALLEKFENFRNSHEKVRKVRVSIRKRYREPIYSDDEAQDISSDEDDSCGNALFFRVKHLALMELDLQSRMYTYEANKSEAIKFVSNISPHIKSYTRLMSQNRCESDTLSDIDLHTPMKKEFGNDLAKEEQFRDKKSEVEVIRDKKQKVTSCQNPPMCSCHAVAWTLMTSSCLSKGANGVVVPHSLCPDCQNICHGYTEIKNFEIGVLFHTRPGRCYKALNPECSVHGKSNKYQGKKRSNMGIDRTKGSPEENASEADSTVILPFPFNVLGGIPYYEEAESRFKHRPFFNGSAKEIGKYGRQLDLPSESPLEFSDSQDLRELSQESEGSKCSSVSYSHRPKQTKEQCPMDNIKKEERSPSRPVRKICLTEDSIAVNGYKGFTGLPGIRHNTKIVAESEAFQLLSLPENHLDGTLKRLNNNDIVKVKLEKSTKLEDDQDTHTAEYDFHDELLLSTSTSSFASDFMC